MAEPILIYPEMDDLHQALEDASDLLDKYDVALPRAEQEYQEAKAARFAELRAEYGVTAANAMVRGDPEVSELRRRRDELKYQMSSLRSYKADVRSRLFTLQDQCRREWQRPSNQE